MAKWGFQNGMSIARIYAGNLHYLDNNTQNHYVNLNLLVGLVHNGVMQWTKYEYLARFTKLSIVQAQTNVGKLSQSSQTFVTSRSCYTN